MEKEMPRAEWVLDKMADCCEHCQMKFRAGYKPGSYTRKHHCRRCGRVFCYNCTSSKFPLCQSLKMGGWSEEAKPSKVCLRCFAALSSTRRASDAGNARKKELTQLPVRRLRELSAEAGATEATIEACLDSDTPKPSLVELLLKLERQREEAKESQLREMRAQLMQLSLREVRQRAIAAGASADSIDDALDNDNAKDAMVGVALAAAQQCPPTTSGGGAAVPALETPEPKAKEAASAVRKASAPSGENPHFGSTGKLAPVALPEGRHVMLSYQWSQQDKVVRVRKALQARGVNCWMDIAGGMKSDVRKPKNFIHSRKS
jgi:hypothetical protein